ncbi:MAG TPA: PspC domain-containing protein [Steroidobacteraceae bacterium]|nr:PspC domain-containing protein [Steroidobacteraceae bacterium]
MRKVTTINLNNNAYQIDEDGYDALRAYLENAARALANNPDREEILADLEQAIADKCRLTLGAHKTVVSGAEILRILKEMGPVSSGTEDAPNSADAGFASASAGASSSASASTAGGLRPRRLYRVAEGMKWGGICTGLAAYAGVDVGLVRLAVILITVFTGFFPCLIIYAGLTFVLPMANTPEEVAAAHGQPFNAQELVDRVKKKHEDFRSERQARREQRRMRREARWWSPPLAANQVPQPAPGYAARVTGGVLLPVLTVMSAVWFAAFAVIMYSIWWGYRHGGMGAWPPGMFHGDPDIPRWVAYAAVVAVYALVAIPIGAGRRAAMYYANGGSLHGWAHAWAGMLWFAIVAVLFLIALYQLPQLEDVLRSITGASHHGLSVQQLMPAWHIPKLSWPQWSAVSLPAISPPANWSAAWPFDLHVANGNDLVTAFTARGGHVDAVALAFAYKGAGDR